ncbi:hypothetical protein K8R04_04280 [Candidatus Uhrbacteria bacterium]|nr:hypothetical protein [Candidatus Uhrbacteria bacterium]
MTKSRFLTALIGKLVAIRVFVQTEIKDANKHPVAVFRGDLEGFLRITQGELLEGFGVKNPNKLTLTIRKAMAVLARIHKGCDSYRTIAEKAETIIKRLHPIHVAELERVMLESRRREMREALEKRFHALSGGKALPDGTLTATLEVIVSELRSELEETTRDKMDEVNEQGLRHPNISRINDANLTALAARLDERLTMLRRVRPVTQKPFAAHLAQRMATT